MDTLDTVRLTLRPIGLTDAPALYTMRSDPSVVEYTPAPLYTSLAQAEEYIARVRQQARRGECHVWAVCLRAAPAGMIGLVCLWNPTNAGAHFDIGYEQNPAFWGNGYMREAVGAALGYAFDKLSLAAVDANPMEANLPSIRLLASCGFVRVERDPDRGEMDVGAALFRCARPK